MTVLTLTAGLTCILVINVCKLLNSFLICNLRSAYVGFYLKFTEETVNDDIKVKLTHTSDDSLTCFLVCPCSERGVFLCKLGKTYAHFLLTCLSLRLDSKLDNRLGKFHGFEYNGSLGIAERIARSCIFQTNASRDIARIAGLDILSVVGVHLKNTSHSFGIILCSVENRSSRVYLSGVNSEVAELSYKGVGSDLERQSRKRLIIGRRSVLFLVRIGVHTLDSGNVKRRRHIIHNSVEKLLNALVLVGRTAGNGNHSVCNGSLADTHLDLFYCKSLASEIFFHDIVVLLGNSLQELFMVFGSLVGHILGNFLHADILSKVIVVNVCFHFNQVNDTLEAVLASDRELNGNSVTFKSVEHHVHNMVEIGAHNVHLIYIGHTGNHIVVSLSPNGFRLRLNASLCTENSYRTVKNSERTLNFNCKVNVTGSVDDIDPMTRPVGSSSGGGDSNTSLLLLRHPVHCRASLVSFAYFVVYTGIKQDTLRSGSFARVNVSHYTNISGLFK